VVIPARGGSKGVPGKNLAPVAGVPLVVRAVRACREAVRASRVVVSTDDPGIAEVAREAGAEVVIRPAELAGDTASSESAVLHALDTLAESGGTAPEIVVLVQCTSPFLTSSDIDGVIAAVAEDGADSALTAAPFHGFVWREDGLPAGGGGGGGGAHGVNHDSNHRARRQDRPRELLETGAAYAMRTEGLRRHRHRFFGRVALVPTDPDRTLEVDGPEDLSRARALAPELTEAPLTEAPLTQALLTQAQAHQENQPHPPAPHRPARDDIDAVVLDFDGTQTDDRVLIDAEGRELVAVHRGDGYAVAALRRAGYRVLILSTETNPVVAARARKLGVPVLHGIDRKDLALKNWCEEHDIVPERVLYVGNDVNDLPCFHLVGWPVAVADAHPVVREAARAVSGVPGGHGAVRDIAGWLLGKELDAT
jgi:YrbI family 3-deoxy-D-manno-octulosonate 8-phosphate phosphatase